MQTVRLYDDKPYETSFEGTVVSAVAGKKEGTVDVVLDRTLFFPEEGGQTPDRGMLAGRRVIDVQIDGDGVITHTLLPGEGETCADAVRELDAPAGRVVPGTIDWDHRYSNMQNHSGEHVLSGLLHSIYGYENVGFHLSDHSVTLDTSGALSDEQILDLERRANEVVYRNVPITCEYPPPEVLATLQYRSKKALTGPVRIVTIEGVDVCACCAPHVARTGEIGIIKILGAVHEKNTTRLFILSGRRALADYEARISELETISHQTNYPQDQASQGVGRLLEEIASLRESLRKSQSKVVSLQLESIRAAVQADTSLPVREDGSPDLSGRSIWIFEESMDNLTQRRFMNALCDMGYRFAGVFAGSDSDGWKYLIGSRLDNANVPNKVLRESFGARGGGKPEMVQGSVQAPQEQLRAVLEKTWN